ncbi:Aspartate aminotransferase [Geobacillus sp. BCO2]|nr:Aspartate aminotransferase [Geobacillus sp. BCO2]
MTVGASQAIDLALRAIIDPGDEVIVVEPSFVAYEPLVVLAGGRPVAVCTSGEDQFQLNPAHLERAITERSKAVIICSPNNPTGTVLGRKELEAIARVAHEHDLLVIADEIYAELTYEGEYTSMAAVSAMRERTILISGFSKGFAMTGWRLGFAAAPDEILQAMLKIHQYA